MYRDWPDGTNIQPEVNGDGVRMGINHPVQKAPDRVVNLLSNLGWITDMSDPDTQEPLFKKMDANLGGDHDPDLNRYWRWYEAMAYEFAKFVNIGLDP